MVISWEVAGIIRFDSSVYMTEKDNEQNPLMELANWKNDYDDQYPAVRKTGNSMYLDFGGGTYSLFGEKGIDIIKKLKNVYKEKVSGEIFITTIDTDYCCFLINLDEKKDDAIIDQLTEINCNNIMYFKNAYCDGYIDIDGSIKNDDDIKKICEIFDTDIVEDEIYFAGDYEQDIQRQTTETIIKLKNKYGDKISGKTAFFSYSEYECIVLNYQSSLSIKMLLK